MRQTQWDSLGKKKLKENKISEINIKTALYNHTSLITHSIQNHSVRKMHRDAFYPDKGRRH